MFSKEIEINLGSRFAAQLGFGGIEPFKPDPTSPESTPGAGGGKKKKKKRKKRRKDSGQGEEKNESEDKHDDDDDDDEEIED
jgi:hypothetical protein